MSLENYEVWRDRVRSIERIAALVPTYVTLATPGWPERLTGAEVTAGYFTLLGVPPATGRDFSAADAKDGVAVILSDGLWRRHFDADSAIVGRQISLSGRSFTVVGVMPARFEPPRFGWLGAQEFWLPFVATDQSCSWGRFCWSSPAYGPASDSSRARRASSSRRAAGRGVSGQCGLVGVGHTSRN